MAHSSEPFTIQQNKNHGTEWLDTKELGKHKGASCIYGRAKHKP